MPKYTHDCEECVFIGTFENIDLWVHPRIGDHGELLNVVARFSDDGPDYVSETLLIERPFGLARIMNAD